MAKDDKIDNSSMSGLNQTAEEPILNNPDKQAYLPRWIFSLTEEEVNRVSTELNLIKQGTKFDNMMRIHRELLGDYDPNDFQQNEITDVEALKLHHKLMLTGFLEKTMSSLEKTRPEDKVSTTLSMTPQKKLTQFL